MSGNSPDYPEIPGAARNKYTLIGIGAVFAFLTWGGVQNADYGFALGCGGIAIGLWFIASKIKTHREHVGRVDIFK